MKCEACGTENLPGAQFCRTCGTALAGLEQKVALDNRFCSKCGAVNGESAAFCIKCGASINVGSRGEVASLPVENVQSDPIPKPLVSARGVKDDVHLPPQFKAAIPQDNLNASKSGASASVSASSQKRISGQPADRPVRKTPITLFVLASFVVVALIVGVAYLFTAGNVTQGISTEPQQAKTVHPVSAETKTSKPGNSPEAVRAAAQPSTLKPKDTNSKSPSKVVVPLTTLPRQSNSYGVGTSPSQQPSPRDSTAQPTPALTATNIPTPVPAHPTASENTEMDWRGMLTNELGRCAEKGLIERVVCVERAKWKYCHPDRWGKFAECPQTAAEKQL